MPDFLGGMEALDMLLEQSNHVCLALPATAETSRLMNLPRLQKMQQGAYLYNVGRGSAIDEQAIVQVLQDGHLGGAGLDVFEQEPLSADSPLWKLPNVWITPHVSGVTPHYYKRFADLFIADLHRFHAGADPENTYNPSLGY